MDKSIVEKLVQFGLITNIDVDAEKYDSVDDLIAQGVITIPGIKNKILEIIGDETESTLEPINDTIITDAPIVDEAPESEVEVNEVTTSEIVVDEAPESEVEVETTEVESDATSEDMEETSDESSKKSKKSKKN